MIRGIPAIMTSRPGIQAAAVPYTQRAQSNTTTQTTTPSVTFGATPTNGKMMVLIVYTDKGTITTPAGWTLKVNQNVSAISLNLSIYWRVAGASEPTTITVTTPLGISCLIAYEFPGSHTGATDDFSTFSFSQASATLDLASVVTVAANDLIIAMVGYYDTVNLTEGPFSYGQGFTSMGYAQAPFNGTSGKPIELVVAFFKASSAGTYHCVFTSTGTETATSAMAIIAAFT